MRFGSLFAGIGGIDLGLERSGMKCKWQIEIDPFCIKVLERHWPRVKRYGDITTVSGWELERVDLIAGGFPCQDISLASATGAGIVGTRSGLWKEFARLVDFLRPKFVFIENVPALRNRGLAMVLQDLWSFGYDAEWHCIPASALGANHERDRIWIVSYPAGMFRQAIIWGEPERDIQAISEDADVEGDGWRSGRPARFDSGYSWQQEHALQAPDIDCEGLEKRRVFGCNAGQKQQIANTHSEPLVGAAIARGERHAWTVEPGVVRMVHGIPNRVDRLRGLGNTVVPQVAEWVGRRIMQRVTHG